jgi:putative phosphoribosyl transferase
LVAAAELPAGAVRTVVSRGGRPDLAQEALARVPCPVLLIVGSHDDVVLELTEQARALMKCETELVIVPGATHLFEEEGALEEVADLAAVWLGERLGKVA